MSSVVLEGAGRRVVEVSMAVGSRRRAAVASAVNRHHARGRRRRGRWEVSVGWRSGRLGVVPPLSVSVGVGAGWACVLSAGVFLVGAVAEVGVGWVGWEEDDSSWGRGIIPAVFGWA